MRSYTLIVARVLILPMIALTLLAQQQRPQEQPPTKTQAPPEEDESFKEKEYTFNPLQATKELNVGNFYFKRGKYQSAARRFEEATRWNPTYGDAFLRWAETLEKLREKDKAKEIYAKFLEVAPDDKRVPEIKKRIGAK